MFKLGKVSVFVCAALAVLWCAASSDSQAAYKQGEVIVKYKPASFRVNTNMNALYDSIGVRSVSYFGGGMKNFEQLVLKDGVSVEQAIARLERSSMVEYAQPNYILQIPEKNMLGRFDDSPVPGLPGAGGGAIPCIPGVDIPGCDPNAKIPCLFPGVDFPPGCVADSNPPPNPNPDPTPAPQPVTERPVLQPAPADVNPPVADPDIAKAYGLEKIQAPEAWKIWRGSKDFVVAVIDTGADYNHPDLAFNMWRNPKPTNGDIVGYDFVHNDGLPYDDLSVTEMDGTVVTGHGTHTAGTIGAVGGNGVGISGVSQRVSIMALKFLSSDGSGTTSDAIKAIDYAIAHGAKVLSNSWGGRGDDNNKALSEAIDRAKDADILFVAAAGNDAADNDGENASYPAAFTNDNLITVAATNEKDELDTRYSNYGLKTTHLAAPGSQVYSLIPGGYAVYDGTSMACPHVAGAAALIWSKNPKLTYKQVKDILLKTVDPLDSLAGKTVTGGRINVLKALRATE